MRLDPTYITKILLFSSIVILLSLTFASLMFGQPNKLTRGFDPDGIACGADFGSREYPYIYFSNPTKDTLNSTVCVKTCPQPDHKKQMPQQLECVANSIVKECKQKISIDKPETQFLIYDSFPYKGNICMPRNLAFYESIKELATPPTRLSDTTDVFQNKWILLLFIVISLASSHFLLDYLKVNTQYCVWGLTLGLFTLVGSLGVLFILQAKEAFKLSEETNSISVFQVDEQYILKMTHIANPYLLIVLCLVFVVLTFYGGYFLYNNYDRIKDLAELFEQVEKFMIDHNYLQEFSYPLIGVFSFFLFLVIYTVLALRSCFKIDFDQIGPFQKVQGGILYYFQYLVIFFFLWGVQILFGLNNFLTSSSLVQWIQVGNIISQQQAQLYNHKLSSLVLTRYFFEEALYNIGKIAHAGFLLLISPLKFVCDAIRDWVLAQKNEKFKAFLQKFLCFPCIFVYENTRSIEDVIYFELSINKKSNISIGICLTLIDKYLELKEEETGTVETFEKLRNIVDSFLLITKIFIGLFCAVLCKALMSFQYFSEEMYSTNLTCLVAAIIGYYIASIYFQIYAIVTQGLGYIYLRTRNISKQYHDSEIQRLDKKTVFEKFQETYSELSKIMNNLEQKALQKN